MIYRFGARFTHNMGNFESLQISEELEDSARGDEKSDELRERIKSKVTDWIIESAEDVERELRGMRKRLDAEQQEAK